MKEEDEGLTPTERIARLAAAGQQLIELVEKAYGTVQKEATAGASDPAFALNNLLLLTAPMVIEPRYADLRALFASEAERYGKARLGTNRRAAKRAARLRGPAQAPKDYVPSLAIISDDIAARVKRELEEQQSTPKGPQYGDSDDYGE